MTQRCCFLFTSAQKFTSQPQKSFSWISVISVRDSDSNSLPYTYIHLLCRICHECRYVSGCFSSSHTLFTQLAGLWDMSLHLIKDLCQGLVLTHCSRALSLSSDDVFFYTDIYSCSSVFFFFIPVSIICIRPDCPRGVPPLLILLEDLYGFVWRVFKDIHFYFECETGMCKY